MAPPKQNWDTALQLGLEAGWRNLTTLKAEVQPALRFFVQKKKAKPCAKANYMSEQLLEYYSYILLNVRQTSWKSLQLITV